MDDNKVAVLIEDLMSQFRVFGEGLQSVNEKIDKMDQRMDKMDQRMDKMDQRMERIEQKLDDHIIENRREHIQIKQMINELDSEVVQIKRVK